MQPVHDSATSLADMQKKKLVICIVDDEGEYTQEIEGEEDELDDENLPISPPEYVPVPMVYQQREISLCIIEEKGKGYKFLAFAYCTLII